MFRIYLGSGQTIVSHLQYAFIWVLQDLTIQVWLFNSKSFLFILRVIYYVFFKGRRDITLDILVIMSIYFESSCVREQNIVPLNIVYEKGRFCENLHLYKDIWEHEDCKGIN